VEEEVATFADSSSCMRDLFIGRPCFSWFFCKPDGTLKLKEDGEDSSSIFCWLLKLNDEITLLSGTGVPAVLVSDSDS
jgi:hypothetical protein